MHDDHWIFFLIGLLAGIWLMNLFITFVMRRENE